MEKDKLIKRSRFEWTETLDSKEWDDFVVQNGGSVFHLWSWRKVLESDGSKALYLACRDSEDRILAVCPFLFTKGKHFTYLDSLPDSPIAGPVISPRVIDLSPILASLQKSVKFSFLSTVLAMRIRSHVESIVQSMDALKFSRLPLHGLYILDFHEKEPKQIWNNQFEKHDRQAVKYYEQRGFGLEFSREESDLVDYLALERPDWQHFRGRIFQTDLLSTIRSYMGNNFGIALVRLGNKAIAGFTVLSDPANSNSAVHLLAIRYSSETNIHSPVTYLNWKTINWAHEHGFRFVDFGSYSSVEGSKHSNLKLKERFGLAFLPRYQFALPTSNLSYSIARKVGRVL
jgi:Acetyltransferase (GNAT) domain